MLNPSNDELATLMLRLLNIVLPNEDKADVIQSNTHINTLIPTHLPYMSENITRNRGKKESNAG